MVLTSNMPETRKLVEMEILHSSFRTRSATLVGASSGASTHRSLMNISTNRIFRSVAYVLVNSVDMKSSMNER